LFLYFLIPPGIEAFTQRGFVWDGSFNLAPDLMTWLVMGICFDFIQEIRKIIILQRMKSHS
jgi:hypothetical protein